MTRKKVAPKSPRSNPESVLYRRIRDLVANARQTIARGVDLLLQVRTNFEIGRHIVEHDQQGKGRAAYGEETLRRLAAGLTSEFGARKLIEWSGEQG